MGCRLSRLRDAPRCHRRAIHGVHSLEAGVVLAQSSALTQVRRAAVGFGGIFGRCEALYWDDSL